jgi:hypothetical protein
MKAPEPLEIEAAAVQRLIDQARRGALDGAAQQRLVPRLRTLLWRTRLLPPLIRQGCGGGSAI